MFDLDYNRRNNNSYTLFIVDFKALKPVERELNCNTSLFDTILLDTM